MPSSRTLQIRQLLREKFSDFIDNANDERDRASENTDYALFANVAENALLAIKEGRSEEAKSDLLLLATTFRWNLNTCQAKEAINLARSGVIHG